MDNRRHQQIWLPSSGVWAAVPASAEPTGAGSSKQRRKKRSSLQDGLERQQEQPTAAATEAAAAAAAAPDTKRPHYTGFELQQDKCASDVEEAEEHPTCPICLVDIVELSEKAVVTTCMHTFCHSCIDRWLSHHKRICPLCKQRVSSVIYDITPAGTYREREVPPSPKLATAGSGQADGDGGLPLLQRLQDFLGVAGLLDPYEQQQLGQERGRGSGGGGGGGAARRLRTEAGSGRPGSRRGTQPSSTAAAAAGGGPAGPRPYFWRLQQRLQAGAYRPGGAAAGAGDGAAGEGPVSEQDYVLLWRRQIYDQDLWAAPLGSEPAHISLGSGSARERRLTEWIDRELQALLQTDDTTIVRGFVMGLLVAYGLEPLSSQQQAGSGQASGQAGGAPAAAAAAAAASRRAAEMVAAAQRGRGVGGVAGRPGSSSGGGGGGGGGSGTALSSSPQEALRPFLHEHAEHFWHELRCFATAPYTLATYDRMVSYLRPQPEPLPQAAAAAGGGAGAGRASRWDQRQRGAALQQAAGAPPGGRPALQRQQGWGGRAVQPARVVLQAGPAVQQRRQEERQEGYQPARDAEVPRRARAGSGGGGSRNPSPPPPATRATAAPAVAQQMQQALQAERAQDTGIRPNLQPQQLASAGPPQVRSRSRSSSRGPQPRRPRHVRTRSRSRSGDRRRRLGRSSRGRGSSRSRSRSRSHDRRHSRRKHRHRRRSSSYDWQRDERASRHSCELPDSDSTHGGYIVGQSDAGDRWQME